VAQLVPAKLWFADSIDFCYDLKKTAGESHRMLVEAYGDYVLGKSQCYEWFKKNKSSDFDVIDEKGGRPPKKDCRQRIANFVGWGWCSKATTTRRSIKCDTRSSLHTFKSHVQDSEGGKMGSKYIERTTARKRKNHLRNSAC